MIGGLKLMKTGMWAIVSRRVTISFAVLTFTTLVAFGQTPVQRSPFESFEVATIKPTAPNPQGRWIRMQSANRFEAHSHAVRTLIAAAYDLSPQAISGGPAWVDSDRWDILAKTPGDVRPTLVEQMSMLRQLLLDRFKLGFHREPKELSIYTLSVSKEGPKLKESSVSPNATPEGPPPLVFVLSPTVVRLPARYATIAEFASILQRSPLDRPVVDRTGLRGRYDFDLEFAPDESLWGGILPRPENSDKPGLFKAIQEQLGLRLEATKGPVDVLVIDHIEKPSDN
jgi:uncharacterized protein (TIGR03435 family)